MRDPDWLSHHVHYVALDELLERPAQTFDDRIEAQERLTEDDVATALQPALASMLLMLPRHATFPAGRFTDYPLSSPDRPKPRRVFRRRERRPWHRGPQDLFFVGDEGIMTASRGQFRAVRYDECVVGLRWSDGSRELWSADGFLVSINPENWKHGAAAVRSIDEDAPPEIWITMDALESSADAATHEAIGESGPQARIQLLSAELDRQPQEGRLWAQLAAALIDVEDWPAAIDAADRASTLDPTDPWARVLKGRALVEAGRQTEAVEAVEEALRIDPVGRQTLCEAVSVLCEAGEAERAARFADRALELYPSEKDVLLAHARVAESLGGQATIT
jgi:hypothetical protein